jgi:NAD(P)-dependent dehydrogenase (short-subunit alcohol dehydrogenase family)
MIEPTTLVQASDGRPWAGRVVVVTGASAGVGRATARLFGARGARVALVARGRDGLEAAARELDALGTSSIVCEADVSSAERMEAVAEETERRLGPIDVWVNNAMVTVMSTIAESTPDEFRRVTDVTYLGAVHGTLAALRRMRPRNRGTIVQVGSALAYRAIPLQSAYCAAKHALRGFTDSLRTELMHENSRVHVTMVQLPALNTPQFDWSRARVARRPQPVPPIYQPEVAAGAVVFAAQARRREVWVGARNIALMFGNKLAPGIRDRYLALTGFASQLTDEPIEPDRRDNLYEPLPGDHGAHGRFGARSAPSSPALWLSMHQRPLALAAVLGAAALLQARSRAPRRPRGLAAAVRRLLPGPPS